MTEIKEIRVSEVFDGNVNIDIKIDKDLHQKYLNTETFSYSEMILTKLIRAYYE
jgi:hypothetical protein